MDNEYIEGSIPRTARKQYLCHGRGKKRQSIECKKEIWPGEKYVEYVACAPAFQSGARYCVPCADAMLKERNRES